MQTPIALEENALGENIEGSVITIEENGYEEKSVLQKDKRKWEHRKKILKRYLS